MPCTLKDPQKKKQTSGRTKRRVGRQTQKKGRVKDSISSFNAVKKMVEKRRGGKRVRGGKFWEK